MAVDGDDGDAKGLPVGVGDEGAAEEDEDTGGLAGSPAVVLHPASIATADIAAGRRNRPARDVTWHERIGYTLSLRTSPSARHGGLRPRLAIRNRLYKGTTSPGSRPIALMFVYWQRVQQTQVI